MTTKKILGTTTSTMGKILIRRLARTLGHRSEAASSHINHAIQALLNLMAFGSPRSEDRKDVRAALHRLWLALRELERDQSS